MPSVPRPHENGTVETNGLRGVNQNNRRNRISGQGSSVPIPKTTPINGTVLNGIIPSGHVASRPTSDQHAGASATSIAITTSTVQAVTSLRPSEISALNSSFELPMRQVLTRSSSMEVLIGDCAEDASNGDD